jgi:apolipoprotein N-acyltransferase
MVTGLVGVYALACAAGIVVAARSDHHKHNHHPLLGLLVTLAVLAVVLAVTLFFVLRIYRRPVYRRVTQYSASRRRRVAKALRRGNPVPGEDLPVAKAIVDVQRSLWWMYALFVIIPLDWVLMSLRRHGVVRWVDVGFAALFLAMLPLVVWQRRKMIRNYERLKRPATSG